MDCKLENENNQPRASIYLGFFWESIPILFDSNLYESDSESDSKPLEKWVFLAQKLIQLYFQYIFKSV